MHEPTIVDSFNLNTTITHVANVIGSVERVARRVHLHQMRSPGVCKAFLIDSRDMGCVWLRGMLYPVLCCFYSRIVFICKIWMGMLTDECERTRSSLEVNKQLVPSPLARCPLDKIMVTAGLDTN